MIVSVIVRATQVAQLRLDHTDSVCCTLATPEEHAIPMERNAAFAVQHCSAEAVAVRSVWCIL